MMNGSYTISEVERAYVTVKRASGSDVGPNGKAAALYDPCRHRLVKKIRRQLNECNHLHGSFRFTQKLVKGKSRTIAIANIPDRITHHLIADRLSSFDDMLHPSAVGFRRRHGTAEAIKTVVNSRHRYPHVISFDIKDAFPSTPDDLILETLDRLPFQKVQAAYLRGFLSTPHRNWRGLPIGASFSPLLFNHALKPLDESLSGIAPFYLRYADNIYLGFDSPPDAPKVQAIALEALRKVGGFQSHKFRYDNAQNDSIMFLGICFTPEGEIFPTDDALQDFRSWASGPVLYRQLDGWTNHYLEVGVEADWLECLVREQGYGFVVSPRRGSRNQFPVATWVATVSLPGECPESAGALVTTIKRTLHRHCPDDMPRRGKGDGSVGITAGRPPLAGHRKFQPSVSYFDRKLLAEKAQHDLPNFLELGAQLMGFLIRKGNDPLFDDVCHDYPEFSVVPGYEFGIRYEKAFRVMRAFTLLTVYQDQTGAYGWSPALSVLKHLGGLLFPNFELIFSVFDDLRTCRISNREVKKLLDPLRYRAPRIGRRNSWTRGYRLNAPRSIATKIRGTPPVWYECWPEVFFEIVEAHLDIASPTPCAVPSSEVTTFVRPYAISRNSVEWMRGELRPKPVRYRGRR